MKPLILFHAGCYDGYTSAWVAANALGGEDAVEMKPIQYKREEKTLEGLQIAGREVYVVDFSFDKATVLDMAALADKMVVLDHHKTAQEALESIVGHDEMLNLTVEFDMDRSGAGMTWDFFHDFPRPLLVDLVEDRDIWKWELENSEELNAWIMSHDFDFETWDKMHRDLSFEPEKPLQEAGAIIRFRDRAVKALVSNAESIVIKGHKVPAVNSAVFQSEVGHALMEEKPGRPFACVWFYKRGQYIYSLRSTDDAEDVGAIAKSLGGGGHRNAAGFVRDAHDKVIE
jgi:oligoribonuclease NrnB/cAMP/cGMP phosphodiesterase (DHH superfamily)